MEETSPTLGSAQQEVRTLAWTDIWRLRGVLLVGLLEAIMNSGLHHLYLPYARTVTRCDELPDADALEDVHSREWSGSALCADRELVARDAQATINLAHGLALGICCVVLPAYGVLADRLGRWTVIAAYFAGVAAMCAVNAAFPAEATLLWSKSLSGLLGDPHPIQHAQIADICSAETRGSCFGLVLVVKMVVGAATGLAFNFGVVSRHLYDYRPWWWRLGGVALAAGAACFLFEETMPAGRPRRPLSGSDNGGSLSSESSAGVPASDVGHAQRRGGREDASLSMGLATAVQTVTGGTLGWTMVVCSLTILGISCWSVVPGWLLIVYKWPQERFGYISLAILPATLAAMVCAPELQRRLGQDRYFTVGGGVMLASLSFLDLAELHQAFFFAAIALLSLAFSSAPVFMSAVTLCVPPADQAKVQGSISAVFHGVSAFSLTLYAAVFKWQKLLPVPIRSLPFYLGTMFTLAAVVVARVRQVWERLALAGAAAGPSADAGVQRKLSNADNADVLVQDIQFAQLM